MRTFLLAMALACASEPPGPGRADTADTGGAPSPCPTGMVSVADAEGTVHFCIDSYEMHVDLDGIGNADQGADWPDASTSAVPESGEGVEPIVLLSWYEAAAACENAGKHLCTSAEWADGCDGVAGEGGSLYPWGNAWDDDACATLTEEGEQVYDTLQPTASLPGCRSAAGTWDQVGNAWEWTDPGALSGDGTPATNKVGGAFYAGLDNSLCIPGGVTDHTPDFQGTITGRCCRAPEG